MRTSVNLKYDTKIIQPWRSAKTGGGGVINIYRKHSTKYETVAMIQYKWLAKLSRVITTYEIIGICRFPKSVANSDRWPTYKVGQLQRFYCTLKKMSSLQIFRLKYCLNFRPPLAFCVYCQSYWPCLKLPVTFKVWIYTVLHEVSTN